MKMLFNCDEFAFSQAQVEHTHHFAYDLEKNFMTPYGVFIPMFTSGYVFIRALRGEFPAKELRKTLVGCRFLHINSHGHVWYIAVDSDENDIAHQQVVTKDWTVAGFRNDDRGNSIAYGHLLKGCKTLDKAVQRIDRIAYDGFFEPHRYNVKEVAKTLLDKNYTEPFFYTRLSDF